MNVSVGDRLIIRSCRLDEPERDGEIVEVQHPDGSPPVSLQNSPQTVDLWIRRQGQAACRYSLITPPSTLRRQIGACSSDHPVLILVNLAVVRVLVLRGRFRSPTPTRLLSPRSAHSLAASTPP